MHPFYKEQIEREMKIRGLSDDTISLYCDNLKIFMRNFKGIKPSDVTLAAVKKFSEKLKNQGQSHRYINMQLASVRFFYRHVCKANFDVGQIPRLKEHKKLPIVFSREEIKQVLDVTTNIKHKAMLATLYGTGMRINELVHLKVTDLNAKEGVIMIRHGKGNRQRLVPLSETLLNLLRQYWQQHKPDSVWVFPGLGKNKLVRVDYLSSLFRMAKKSVKFVNWAAATA